MVADVFRNVAGTRHVQSNNFGPGLDVPRHRSFRQSAHRRYSPIDGSTSSPSSKCLFIIRNLQKKYSFDSIHHRWMEPDHVTAQAPPPRIHSFVCFFRCTYQYLSMYFFFFFFFLFLTDGLYISSSTFAYFLVSGAAARWR